MSAVLVQDTSIAAHDGYALAATVFTPAAAPSRALLMCVWPKLPLAMVGHSFGGQALGLAPSVFGKQSIWADVYSAASRT